MLDIGADIGAVVIYTGAALDGFEIEIKRHDADWDGTHTAVRRRASGHPDAAPVFAAIFGRLPVGRYDLRVRGGSIASRVRSVEVAGGQVVEALFPG